MDVVLSVLKPKKAHISQPYSPQLYEILLLDSKTPPGDRVKQEKYMPMFPNNVLDEEPREQVLTQLCKLTGIKGERAVQLQGNEGNKGLHRESLSKFSQYFVPVGSYEKISKKHLEQTQYTPAFYPFDYVIEAVNNGSVHFTPPTQIFLLNLESWLIEKHQKVVTVECLFRPRAEFRVHMTVHNPVFIPSRISSNGDNSAIVGKTAQFPPKIQLTANEALANMLSIEKCDTVVMNPLFGSGLPYKTKVNRYEINHYWPRAPDYNSIIIPASNLPEPRWRDKYPVHNCAAEGDHVELESLLKQGYKHSQLDSIMWAPIHYAVWYGNLSVVETLLENGSSPNICDGEMNTPLHIAAKKGLPTMAQRLLRCPDINLNLRDKDGKRPIDVSHTVSDKSSRHEQVEKYLREASAQTSLIIEVSLMDSSSKTLQLTSGLKTTVHQLNQQMMKVFNLPKNYTDFFTLWICSKSLELQLKLDHEVVSQLRNWQKRSVNMLTEATNLSEEEPCLKWRKNVKISVDKEKKLQHPKALELLFQEAYHNYINGLYPCEDRDVVNFATTVFTLQHQGASNVKSILTKINNEKLKELVPTAMLRIKDSGHWISKIGKEYSTIKDLDKQKLKLQFLEACQKLPVYGSAFFTGHIASQLRKSLSHTQCYIGVNAIGIHIINMTSKQMIVSLKYREITWKHILEKSLLEIKVIKPESRESRNQRISVARGLIEIRTRQAGLIDHLMQQLGQVQVELDVMR